MTTAAVGHTVTDEPADDTTVQRWCAWCGPVVMVLGGLGIFVIAPFLPPPDPRDSAEAIARFYVENQTRIRVGMVVCLIGAAFAFPFFTAISKQMRRIEGHWSSLALMQFAGGIVMCLLFSYPCIIFGVAAYRPATRSAETTQTLNDLGWILFVGFAMTVIMQTFVIGVAVLRDNNPEPVFPRWIGFFCMWCTVLLFPGNFVLAFNSGPLAWNGLFALYIPLAAFGSWYIVMTRAMLKALSAQETRLHLQMQPRSTRA